MFLQTACPLSVVRTSGSSKCSKCCVCSEGQCITEKATGTGDRREVQWVLANQTLRRCTQTAGSVPCCARTLIIHIPFLPSFPFVTIIDGSSTYLCLQEAWIPPCLFTLVCLWQSMNNKNRNIPIITWEAPCALSVSFCCFFFSL